jgi:hypothetical protein
MLLGNGKLLPEERFKDFQRPPETLPRSPGHWVEWVNYAKGQGPVPGSNFQYSGWTTEANHLGNVAYRTGKKIVWDYVNLRATNAPEAAPFIKRPVYCKGWDDILKANRAKRSPGGMTFCGALSFGFLSEGPQVNPGASSGTAHSGP